MRGWLVGLVLVGLIVVSFLHISAPSRVTYLSTCAILDHAGTYVLTRDILSGPLCFNVTASHVNFNGAGHTITGDKRNDHYALYADKVSDLSIANVSFQHYGAGIYLHSVTDVDVSSVTVRSGYCGICTVNTADVSISHSTLDSNYFGTYFINGTRSVLTNLTYFQNENYAAYFYLGKGHLIKESLFRRNFYPVGSKETVNVSFSSTLFTNNINSLTRFTRPTPLGSPGNVSPFTFYSPYDLDHPCAECSYSIGLYPSEDSLTLSHNGSTILGSFVPSRVGLYSLRFSFLGPGNISEQGKLIYLIGAKTSAVADYFVRGRDPTHGQVISWGIYHQDSGSLVSEAPREAEVRSCSDWIQFSPDELPRYLFGVVQGATISLTYLARSNESAVGFQRFVSYDSDVNISIPVQNTHETVSSGSFSFTTLWAMNYYWEWYWLAFKLVSPHGEPIVFVDPRVPSRASISYLYSSTPAITSFDSQTVSLYSATMDVTLRNATLVFQGQGPVRLSLLMPNSSRSYDVFYENMTCDANPDCLIEKQARGEIALSLTVQGPEELVISS